MLARLATLTVLLVIGLAGTARSQEPLVIHRFAPFGSGGISVPTSLMEASDGFLYGTTIFGRPGLQTGGVVFKISPQGGGYAGLWMLTSNAVIEARSGDLYAVGQSDTGSAGVFRLTRDVSSQVGTLETVRAFDAAVDGVPSGPLVEGRDGHLYGSAAHPGGGVRIYRLTIDGAITWLDTLGGSQSARSALMQAADGNVYGTTFDGGNFGFGTVFKMTPAGAVTVLHHFSGADGDGAAPEGTLAEGLEGGLYGTTTGGGAHGFGTVFRLTSDGGLSTVYDFTGKEDGGGPGGLIRTSDGRFCGSTLEIRGTLYCVTAAGSYSRLHTLDSANEGGSTFGLVHGLDGYFYAAGVSFITGGTVFRLRNPAPCDSTVSLWHRSSVLDIRVTLRSELSAFAGAWLVHGANVSPLWSTFIPAITPAAIVHVPLWPIGNIGTVGVFTLVVTSANDVCADWRTINTGGS